jgi:hypothetical protein
MSKMLFLIQKVRIKGFIEIEKSGTVDDTVGSYKIIYFNAMRRAYS